MKLQATIRRLALVLILLLVPALAVLSFDRWPAKPDLDIDSAAIATDTSIQPSTPAVVSAVRNDGPVTLQNWEDTDNPSKKKKSPKGKGKGPPEGVPPGPPKGVPPGPPKGIK
jgi:hypothetical protein